MPYKIGDSVKCQIETINGRNRIVGQVREEELPIQEFLIIHRFLPYQGCDYYTYSIMIPDDFSGWYISKFHTINCNVREEFLGKKFFDITEASIVQEDAG